MSTTPAAATLQAQVDLARRYHAAGALPLAASLYEQVLKANANHAHALHGLGLIAWQRGDPSRGVELIDRATVIAPNEPSFHSNRALLANDLMRWTEAMEGFDRALALKPDHASAQYNKAMLLLLTGELRRGFELYEWRFRSTRTARRLPQPLWLGDESLAGKTLLLHAEQGLGDSIQFSRYALLAAERGARVALEVPAALTDLLATLDSAPTVLASGATLPAFDLHCPLPSLPLAFGTGTVVGDIPGPLRYLKSDPGKVARWSARLGPRTRPRVGLSWSGSTQHPGDARRSMALAQCLAGLPKDIDYVALQKDVRPTDAAALRGHAGLRHFGSEQLDFSDTAALAELMDVVVSVDTSVAHLAAAIGRPTWLMLPHVPDWRWQLERSDSPWYPTVRLYRQLRAGDWTTVLSAVAHDLRTL